MAEDADTTERPVAKPDEPEAECVCARPTKPRQNRPPFGEAAGIPSAVSPYRRRAHRAAAALESFATNESEVLVAVTGKTVTAATPDQQKRSPTAGLNLTLAARSQGVTPIL